MLRMIGQESAELDLTQRSLLSKWGKEGRNAYEFRWKQRIYERGRVIQWEQVRETLECVEK
ncbi:unnamed protein product (macronuclear) [Paramecium tetraurelia]|uniref:Uncharacterized protein n=1 Tax=Paramecium tetraurelia TaxID=5888 RepID=A0DXG2_PARTE|nr:uncharacterized protein GSPATT00021362001 [Paramecium tetraurelia]CAK87729.1 unnamed protein product [Paramecium tetraurelia]|eukprot:XP_001455126.1 hypothetical protein (macronuclear) [Paramecium tetraurelia strain d4-2]